MPLKKYPALTQFLSTVVMDSSPEDDAELIRKYSESVSPDAINQLRTELTNLLDSENAHALTVEDIGSESNRWFESIDQAKDWFRTLLDQMGSMPTASDARSVKDSNGTPLQEGDSVLVIKDLKVKGGSSDLKRGTVVKKIHLIDDPEMIEARVNGTTLVLKTCFLKKA